MNSEYVFLIKYFKKKNIMELQRIEHIHLKYSLQHTTNLEALVKRQSALATVILLMNLVKHRITMEALEISQISTLLLSKFWVYIQLSKWSSHHVYIKYK